MNTKRWRQIEDLFHSALELPRAERAPYLARACADDAELRDEVGSLLRESDDDGELLSKSALPLGLLLLSRPPGTPAGGSG